MVIRIHIGRCNLPNDFKLLLMKRKDLQGQRP